MLRTSFPQLAKKGLTDAQLRAALKTLKGNRGTARVTCDGEEIGTYKFHAGGERDKAAWWLWRLHTRLQSPFGLPKTRCDEALAHLKMAVKVYEVKFSARQQELIGNLFASRGCRVPGSWVFAPLTPPRQRRR
jgi:hypothetical protein